MEKIRVSKSLLFEAIWDGNKRRFIESGLLPEQYILIFVVLPPKICMLPVMLFNVNGFGAKNGFCGCSHLKTELAVSLYLKKKLIRIKIGF